MSVIKEFKEFALKGSMIDLAIGVIIGAAFGKVISSLVSDIIMPPIGMLIGGIDFSSFQALLKPASESQPEVAIKYGNFINTLLNFLIVVAVIFAVIKSFNKLRRKKEENPTSKECPECLSAIPIHAQKCKFCCSNLNE